MAFFKSAVNVSCLLASLCSIVLSQAPPASTPTDPALFANLFMSSPQAGPSSNMINPPGPGSAADLSSLVGGGNPGFASSVSGGSLPPNPMFPTLGGSSMGSMPPAMPRPNPFGGLMKMMLLRNMDMGGLMPLLAFGGLGGGMGGRGGGGLFSNPFFMINMMNNM